MFSDYPYFLDSLVNSGFNCIEQLVSCYSNRHIMKWLAQSGCDNNKVRDKLEKKLEIIRQKFNKLHSAQSFQIPTPSLATASLEFGNIQKNYHFSLPIAALNIPERVDLIARYKKLPVKDQAHRGTCAAQATATLCELTSELNFPLSAVPIYIAAKKLDGNTAEGTSLSSALTALQQKGSCPEELAPYHVFITNKDISTVKLTCVAEEQARKNKIQDYLVMEPGQQCIEVSKAILAGALSGRPRPILVGMKEDLHLLTHTFAYATGEVSGHSPLDVKNKWYHHARVLLGAHDHPDYPGGGYVILSQSWGEHYAATSQFAPGTNIMSYKHFSEQCLNVGLILFDGERKIFSRNSESQPPTSKLTFSAIQAFNFVPFSNNHIGIWGKSGCKKTTFVANMLPKLLISQPCLNVQYIDPHNHAHTLLSSDYRVVDSATIGLPFPFLLNTVDAPQDLKVHALMEDFKCASGTLGARQSGAIRRLLENTLTSEVLDNLALKENCEQQLSDDIKDHLAPLLLLLRTNKSIELDNSGIHLHHLLAFRRSKSSQVLYAVSLMNYLLNRQIKDSSKPTILVLDEAKMFFTPLGLSFLDSFLSEARKFNLHMILISQERPDHKFVNNLAHEFNMPKLNEMATPLQICGNESSFTSSPHSKNGRTDRSLPADAANLTGEQNKSHVEYLFDIWQWLKTH